ncbi:jumonji domain containing 8, putative [Acanthamoeba castellanii str. Neff]|uniref:Jumonji domain containing 8, putative n=1 Tax=Acanthamoeba castellanii (strain ATCC 30010 / Neff) TaxID=1257118 RepID=L8GLB3_ACACF|nr:jumonji domain containing 8, putative [Acanthamoeba castellanii str. Neff]ELR13589.1 jumonji domain containing 8, putative [Acanthamoeba castellanii str. Neff]
MDACKLQLLMAAVWLVVVLGLVQAVLAQPPEQLQNNGSIDSPLCSLARRSLLTQEEFESLHEEREPVIIAVPLELNAAFRSLTTKERLVKDYGEKSLVLSTANTNSYAKRRMTLKQYTAQIVDRPTTLSDRGDSTFYHFGDNDHTSFQALFATYVLPPWHATNTTAPHPSLSFGFAGHGSGVPLHTHGAVFAEVLHGRKVVPFSVLCLLTLVSFCNLAPTKRWFLYPPSYTPLFDPNETTLSTLNIGEFVVFMSTFL